MGTDAYREGIGRLLRLLDDGRVALMCVERSPRGCHRRYISKTLEDLGIQVEHIKKVSKIKILEVIQDRKDLLAIMT